MKISLGIDLGTTYSSIGFFNSFSNRTEMIEIPPHSGTSISSTVIMKYHTTRNTTNFEVKYPTADDSRKPYFTESKRFIGLTYSEFEKNNLKRNYWPFSIQKDNETDYIKMEYDELIRVRNTEQKFRHSFYPEEISAIIVNKLLKVAKNKFNEYSVTSAVVSVPVCFSPKQREATIKACKLAGFEQVELINEPTAALITYHYLSNQITVGKTVLIVDIGGGTMDVCCAKIIKSFDYKNTTDDISTVNKMNDGIEILATGGDQFFGGNDFDDVCIDLIKEKLSLEDENINEYFDINENDTDHMKQIKRRNNLLLKLKAVETKLDLSSNYEKSNYSSSLDIELKHPVEDDLNSICCTIGRFDFIQKCHEKGLIMKIDKIIRKTLQDANIDSKTIDIVIPIGGTCKLPIIQEIIKLMFGDAKKFGNYNFNPLTAVCEGCSIHDYHCLQQSKESNIIEKIPYSLGLRMSQNKFKRLISKNDSLPISASTKLLLQEDNQQKLTFAVFQGEEMFTNKQNMTLLNSITVEIPPGMTVNEYRIVVCFDVDRSGILTIKIFESKSQEIIKSKSIQLPSESSSIHSKNSFENLLKHLKQTLLNF